LGKNKFPQNLIKLSQIFTLEKHYLIFPKFFQMFFGQEHDKICQKKKKKKSLIANDDTTSQIWGKKKLKEKSNNKKLTLISKSCDT
jgi:hypothetical protein